MISFLISFVIWIIALMGKAFFWGGLGIFGFLAGLLGNRESQPSSVKQPKKQPKKKEPLKKITDIDKMGKEEFRKYISQILCHNGFEDITSTPSAGDFGIDMTAHRDGCRYVIRYIRNGSEVGDETVQEVYLGKAYYDADKAIVITNRDFTDEAISIAREKDVDLWDRKVLEERLNRANREIMRDEFEIVRPEKDEFDIP